MGTRIAIFSIFKSAISPELTAGICAHANQVLIAIYSIITRYYLLKLGPVTAWSSVEVLNLPVA